jgi:hypothetical protein
MIREPATYESNEMARVITILTIIQEVPRQKIRPDTAVFLIPPKSLQVNAGKVVTLSVIIIISS